MGVMNEMAPMHDELMKRYGPKTHLMYIFDSQPSELAIFFEDRPTLMLHTVGIDKGNTGNYSITDAPLAAAYYGPVQVGSDWARFGQRPPEYITLSSPSEFNALPEAL